MVIVAFDSNFQRTIEKLRDSSLKERVKKQIEKVVNFPEIGKPMRYGSKGTREVRIPPFRLSYIFFKEADKIVFLDLYHKDTQ